MGVRYRRLIRIVDIGLAALAALLTSSACGNEDAKDAATTKEQCESTREYFARAVWAPVMGEICIDCHAPGGLAPANGASFQLMPPGYPGFLEENFRAVQELAKTTYEGTPIMLLKPLGRLDHGGGQVLQKGSDEYKALVELTERLDGLDECPPSPAPAIPSVELLGPSATLRKACLELVGRLPTPEETQSVVDGGEGALPGAIDALMQEQGFIDRVEEIWNDVLLTDRYLSYTGHALNVLDDEDFPLAATYYDTLADDVKEAVNLRVAREPLDLIGYVVKNDRPFTEILTAGYTVVNDATAAVYNIAPPPADYVGNSELREGRIISLHNGAALEWPHAGVLTSPMFLNRFPTTPTNRNRHRARKIFEIFLATDILQIADRPINPQESAKYINPTRDDPTCNQCHRQIDPVAGAFLRFNDYSQASYEPEHEWHSEMFAPGFGDDTMEVAEFDRAPQWLAEHLVGDPRFARAVVQTMFRGLLGQDPLEYPQDSSSDDYSARLGAWEAQEATLNAISVEFAKNGYSLKKVVRDIVLSPFFRAAAVAKDAPAEEAARLSDIGTARLSTPELLSRKILAVTGVPWSREWDLEPWLADDYRILYGGIDSDVIVTRLTVPNGIMAAVQERMANEVACAATAWDFLQPQANRYLFRNVELTDTPATNADAIRRNVQYLHARLLGEDLSLKDPEIDRTVQLFDDTLAEGAQKVTSGELSSNITWSCQGRRNPVTGEDLPDGAGLSADESYVIRAWMAVITYLLADYRFLYE